MNPYEPPKSTESLPSFLNAKLTPATCPHCQYSFQGVARKSFLGFQKFTCESCHKPFSYPLYRGYRITYWLLLAVAFVVSSNAPRAQPGIFVGLMSLAVLIDLYLLWKRR